MTNSIEDEDVELEEEEEEEEEGEEEEEEEEGEGEELNLAVISLKSLARYRRDDLVRLCTEREIVVVGNKKQLAKSLILWVRFFLSLSRCSSSFLLLSSSHAP